MAGYGGASHVAILGVLGVFWGYYGRVTGMEGSVGWRVNNVLVD
jgi:hypothetical protein